MTQRLNIKTHQPLYGKRPIPRDRFISQTSRKKKKEKKKLSSSHLVGKEERAPVPVTARRKGPVTRDDGIASNNRLFRVIPTARLRAGMPGPSTTL